MKTRLIVSTLLGIVAMCAAQEVIDLTPSAPQPVEPPKPTPVYEIRLDPKQREQLRDMALPALASGNAIRSVSVVLHGEGKDRRATVTLTADIGPAYLDSIRGAIAPEWAIPSAVKARPIRSITAGVTNDGSARVVLRYE
jgi:hypothetical protein